jgi:chromosomal replication initiation ATPase DnaA
MLRNISLFQSDKASYCSQTREIRIMLCRNDEAEDWSAEYSVYNVDQTPTRTVTIDAIQLAVAELFRMPVAELNGNSSKRAVVVPRQIAMYLAKQLTEASLPEIGREFGGKHHTTVMHSIARIDEQKRNNPAMNTSIETLIETLTLPT